MQSDPLQTQRQLVLSRLPTKLTYSESPIDLLHALHPNLVSYARGQLLQDTMLRSIFCGLPSSWHPLTEPTSPAQVRVVDRHTAATPTSAQKLTRSSSLPSRSHRRPPISYPVSVSTMRMPERPLPQTPEERGPFHYHQPPTFFRWRERKGNIPHRPSSEAPRLLVLREEDEFDHEIAPNHVLVPTGPATKRHGGMTQLHQLVEEEDEDMMEEAAADVVAETEDELVVTEVVADVAVEGEEAADDGRLNSPASFEGGPNDIFPRRARRLLHSTLPPDAEMELEKSLSSYRAFFSTQEETIFKLRAEVTRLRAQLQDTKSRSSLSVLQIEEILPRPERAIAEKVREEHRGLKRKLTIPRRTRQTPPDFGDSSSTDSEPLPETPPPRAHLRLMRIFPTPFWFKPERALGNDDSDENEFDDIHEKSREKNEL